MTIGKGNEFHYEVQASAEVTASKVLNALPRLGITDFGKDVADTILDIAKLPVTAPMGALNSLSNAIRRKLNAPITFGDIVNFVEDIKGLIQSGWKDASKKLADYGINLATELAASEWNKLVVNKMYLLGDFWRSGYNSDTLASFYDREIQNYSIEHGIGAYLLDVRIVGPKGIPGLQLPFNILPYNSFNISWEPYVVNETLSLGQIQMTPSGAYSLTIPKIACSVYETERFFWKSWMHNYRKAYYPRNGVSMGYDEKYLTRIDLRVLSARVSGIEYLLGNLNAAYNISKNLDEISIYVLPNFGSFKWDWDSEISNNGTAIQYNIEFISIGYEGDYSTLFNKSQLLHPGLGSQSLSDELQNRISGIFNRPITSLFKKS